MTNESKASVKGMSLKKKALVALCAVVGVVAIVVTSVLATVAYLTSSATISNTFSIGEVGITMDEGLVNEDGRWIDRVNNRGNGGNNYTLVPGGSYDKDPTIHVTAGSQDSYLFAIVDNEISGAVCKSYGTTGHTDHKTIAMQLAENGWARYTTVNIGTVYVYAGFLDESKQTPNVKADGTVEDATKIPTVNTGSYILFEHFYIDENTVVKNYNGAKISINAIAIQDTTFEGNVQKAWEAVMSTYSYIVNGSVAGS